MQEENSSVPEARRRSLPLTKGEILTISGIAAAAAALSVSGILLAVLFFAAGFMALLARHWWREHRPRSVLAIIVAILIAAASTFTLTSERPVGSRDEAKEESALPETLAPSFGVPTARSDIDGGAYSRSIAEIDSQSLLERSATVRELGRLAKLDPSRRANIAQTLVDLIQRRAPYDAVRAAKNTDYPTLLSKHMPDVYAALSVLTDPAVSSWGTPIDLRKVSLRKAELPDGSNFAQFDLSDAHLDAHSKMNEANFTGARLIKTDLARIDAKRARFQKADLTGAYLMDAHLENACLHGAILTLARDLDEAHLLGAYVDASTRWQDGFDAHSRGVRTAPCPYK